MVLKTNLNGKRTGIVFAAGVIGGILVLLYLFHPSQIFIFPPCLIHSATGYSCPGCGSLRAIHHLLHGDVGAAISLNPLMVVLLPVVGVMFLKPTWLFNRWMLWGTLGVIIFYGIARNIPIEPFIWLAP